MAPLAFPGPSIRHPGLRLCLSSGINALLTGKLWVGKQRPKKAQAVPVAQGVIGLKALAIARESHAEPPGEVPLGVSRQVVLHLTGKGTLW